MKKVAIVALTSDEGCQFILLDLGKRLFDLFKEVELVNFSLIEQVCISQNIQLLNFLWYTASFLAAIQIRCIALWAGTHEDTI